MDSSALYMQERGSIMFFEVINFEMRQQKAEDVPSDITPFAVL